MVGDCNRVDCMPSNTDTDVLDAYRHGGAGRVGVRGLLAFRMTLPNYRVVCGLFDQHSLHAMHQRPMDSYTAAIDLMHQLNDPAERCATPSLADACQPHRVQQAEIVWSEV